MSKLVTIRDNKVVIEFRSLVKSLRNPKINDLEAEILLRESFREIAAALLQVTSDPYEV